MRPCKVVLRTIVLRRTAASLEIGQPTRCTSNGPNWLSRRPSVRSCGKISERRSLSLRYGLFWKLSMSGGTADIMASRRAKCGHLQVHDLSKHTHDYELRRSVCGLLTVEQFRANKTKRRLCNQSPSARFWRGLAVSHLQDLHKTYVQKTKMLSRRTWPSTVPCGDPCG